MINMEVFFLLVLNEIDTKERSSIKSILSDADFKYQNKSYEFMKIDVFTKDSVRIEIVSFEGYTEIIITLPIGNILN